MLKSAQKERNDMVAFLESRADYLFKRGAWKQSILIKRLRDEIRAGVHEGWSNARSVNNEKV